MLGQRAEYDQLPYFFTDQYDLGMEYVGYLEPGGYDQVVFRGDVAGRDVTDDIKRLIRSRTRVDADRLADTGVPLSELAAVRS